MQIPSFQQLRHAIRQRLFTLKEQQAFLEDVALLIEDGVIANQAIETISKSGIGLSVEVANAMLMKLAEGKQLADGMQGWFNDTVVEIIRAGEEGGTLAQSMQAAAKTITQRSSAFTSLISSLLYPLIVLCLGLAVTVFIKNSVFESFIALKPVAQWPENGRLVLALANFLEYGWWALVLIVVAIVAGFGYLMRHYIGDMRAGLDKVPIISMYRKLTAAHLMETLGLLLTNGVVLKKALKILQRSASPYLGAHLLAMEYRLSGGKENIADVLNTGLLDENDLMRLRVIAKGKGFAHALIRQGRNAAEQGAKAIQLTGKIAGAVLLLCGGGLAAFLVITIYSLGSALSGAG